MKSNIKKSFRNYLLIGLLPFATMFAILMFVFWALASKSQNVEQKVDNTTIVHDTIYVKVECKREHFEPRPIEVTRRKEVPTPQPIVVKKNELDTTN